MTTVEKILAVVKSRGLTIGIKNGQPVISGDPALVNPPLHAAIVEFRSQILDYLKLTSTKPTPAREPDFSRTVFVMDVFGQTDVVVASDFQMGDAYEPAEDRLKPKPSITKETWKHGHVAWQYHGETGWRPIVGKEDLFPSGCQHA